MFGSPPLNAPINNIGLKDVKVTPKPMAHSQILLMPQMVPCPRCQIGVTILELVHRAPDGTVTCRRGHAFQITQVAQYFGRIDNSGTAADVEQKVREWLDRPEPVAPMSLAVWPLVLAVSGGIILSWIVLAWFILYALRG
jgi:hypothetical protein